MGHVLLFLKIFLDEKGMDKRVILQMVEKMRKKFTVKAIVNVLGIRVR